MFLGKKHHFLFHTTISVVDEKSLPPPLNRIIEYVHFSCWIMRELSLFSSLRDISQRTVFLPGQTLLSGLWVIWGGRVLSIFFHHLAPVLRGLNHSYVLFHVPLCFSNFILSITIMLITTIRVLQTRIICVFLTLVELKYDFHISNNLQKLKPNFDRMEFYYSEVYTTKYPPRRVIIHTFRFGSTRRGDVWGTRTRL